MAVVASITGCGSDTLNDLRPDQQVEAARRMTAYLEALGQDGGDYGWTLLHPTTREFFADDRTSYVDALGASSEAWRGSGWVLGAVLKDDDLYCADLRFRAGFDAPSVLTGLGNTILNPRPDSNGFRICVFIRGEDDSGIVGG